MSFAVLRKPRSPWSFVHFPSLGWIGSGAEAKSSVPDPIESIRMSGSLVGRARPANRFLLLGVPAEAGGFFEGWMLSDAHAAGFFDQ